MKTTFCKIFELKDYQVLITKEYDHQEDVFLVRARIEHKGLTYSINHGYKVEKDRNKAFLETTDKEAIMLKNMILDHVKKEKKKKK